MVDSNWFIFSCPASGQDHITNDNNFNRVGGQPNHLQTGLFGIFRLNRGSALFLHCQLDVCTEADQCKPVRAHQHGISKILLYMIHVNKANKRVLNAKWYAADTND